MQRKSSLASPITFNVVSPTELTINSTNGWSISDIGYIMLRLTRRMSTGPRTIQVATNLAGANSARYVRARPKCARLT